MQRVERRSLKVPTLSRAVYDIPGRRSLYYLAKVREEFVFSSSQGRGRRRCVVALLLKRLGGRRKPSSAGSGHP